MSNQESRQLTHSRKDWDEIRLQFSTSLMVDTSLVSLSENLEIDTWPLRGTSETPAKYIDFSWDELFELPGLAEKPERIDLLIDILHETQAFDDPFGDMVASVDAAAGRDDEILKNLERKEIPKEYPLALTALTQDTLEFCQAEQIETLEQFSRFSQRMAQNIVVGGDFKGFLNAMLTGDQNSLAIYLPYRPGKPGLWLPEGIGIVLKQLSDNERYSLLKSIGYRLDDEQSSRARLSRDQVAQLENILQDKIDEVVKFFPDQLRELQRSLAKGQTTLERYFVLIDDPEREAIACEAMARYLKERAPELPIEETPRKRGFFGKIFGRG